MLLTMELAKTMKAGDYFEYIYPATYLNNSDILYRCTFLELSQVDENKYNRLNDTCVMIPCIRFLEIEVSNLTDKAYKDEKIGKITDTALTIPSEIGGNLFKTWRNGWNNVEIVKINDKVFEREINVQTIEL